MEFLELMKQRISDRKFTDEQITEEQLEKILAAGKRAPVGSNRYGNIHITVVRNQQVLQQLAQAACLRRMDLKEMAEIISDVSNRDEILNEAQSYDPFYHAPTVIFVSHKKQSLEPGIEFCDVATVVNCMHLEALDLGLGSCFMWYALDSMRRLPELDHTELLRLPEDFEPLLGLAVGNISKCHQERSIKEDRVSVDYL